MATTRTVTRMSTRVEPKATVTATTTHEIKLRPEIKRKLLTELRAWAELRTQQKALKAAIAKHVARVRELRESTGERKLEIEGFKLTDVSGTTTKLDEKALMVKFDLTQDQIDSCKITKPKKSYEKITAPGDNDDDE